MYKLDPNLHTHSSGGKNPKNNDRAQTPASATVYVLDPFPEPEGRAIGSKIFYLLCLDTQIIKSLTLQKLGVSEIGCHHAGPLAVSIAALSPGAPVGES